MTALLLAKAGEGRRALQSMVMLSSRTIEAGRDQLNNSHIVVLDDAAPSTPGQPSCRSTALVLRPFEPGDVKAVLAYRNDPAVSRFQGWPLPFTEARFARLLDPQRRLAETGWISWCVCEGGNVIGDIGLRPHGGGEAEVGVALATEAQGHGYASEALTRLSVHAFSDLGAERLHAGVHPGNGRVIRLFTRAGWRCEGTAVQAYWHRDHWDDEATFGLSRTAWRQRNTP